MAVKTALIINSTLLHEPLVFYFAEDQETVHAQFKAHITHKHFKYYTFGCDDEQYVVSKHIIDNSIIIIKDVASDDGTTTTTPSSDTLKVVSIKEFHKKGDSNDD